MAGRQGTQTVKNMLWSLVVIALAAGVIYIFIPHNESKSSVKRVDYRVELLTARRAAAYPVAAPEGLAKAWKPTSVRFNGADHDTWHLGFLDPDEEYVAIEQSTDKPRTFIKKVTHNATKTKATEEIGGRTWQRYEGDKYDALVFSEKGATTVVTGTASFGQLTKMAESLKMA
ncbi:MULTISPECIES: DUF4245 domain-containing protein [Streptomyces]|uniref:DUF4245 domain-containing protein n=1 Tax=Streptomyces TaxID=1883 RepID=UPI00099EC224|nr:MULTISPECIES: DUF4245 domain-containing protein [Streptomyces]